MAVRTDITVDFSSPVRVITIAAPSTELDIADLIDTLDSIHAANTSEPHLYSFISNDELVVGLNAFLYEAVISFEARTGPDLVLCSVSGGSVAAEGRAPFKPTAFTKVVVRRLQVDLLTVQRFLQLHSRTDRGIIGGPVIVEGNFYIDSSGNNYIDSSGNRYKEE